MSIKIQKYRVKPDYQEAVEVSLTNMPDIAIWCGGQVMEGADLWEDGRRDYLYIPTIHGPITARPGEIVAKDSNGRFNVFDKDKFLSRYEALSNTRSTIYLRD